MSIRRDGERYIQCSGKKQYRSYWAAVRSSKRLNKKQEKAKANAYHCQYCHFYHVGNTMGVMKRRRQARHTDKWRRNGRGKIPE